MSRIGNFLKGGDRGERRKPGADERSAWDKLGDEVKFPGDRKETAKRYAERQQRKIIASLLYNLDYIKAEDVRLNVGDRDEYLDRLVEGAIGTEEEQELLMRVVTPMDREGASEVLSRMDDAKQQKKILSTVAGEGSQDWGNVTARTLENFMRQFPSPMDFEAESVALLERVKESNPEEKYKEYLRSMRGFKKNVYGKRQEYWEQMKALRKEAGVELEIGDFSRGEVGEKLVGSVGVYEMSKGQAKTGMLAEGPGEVLPRDVEAQDAHFELPEKGLFAVFDGAGGEFGGKMAAITAKQEMMKMAEKGGLNNKSEIMKAMSEVSQIVGRNSSAGITTGVVGKISEARGRKKLEWVNMGDSRIYLVRDGRAELLSEDEGFRNVLYNAIGAKEKKDVEYNKAKQSGAVSLRSGDRIVLCSDGVTGDEGKDLMGERELGAIVSRARSASFAAQDLVEQARKMDDRTALVVEV